MKKTKRILMIACSLLLILVLAGCGNKTPLSPENFKSKLEEKKYTVTDLSTYMTEETKAATVYAATKDDKIVVEYLKYSSVDEATKYFNELKEELIKTGEGKTKSNVEVNMGNYNKYELTADGNYGVVERVEDTIMLAEGKEEVKKEIQDLFKDLGY